MDKKLHIPHGQSPQLTSARAKSPSVVLTLFDSHYNSKSNVLMT